MDEQTTTMQFDTEKFMRQYMLLSQNKLESELARSYTALVKDEVGKAQDRADQIVNALTSRTKPPDFPAARNALGLLASAPDVVVAHWQPFIATIAEVLPPREEGEVDAPVSDVDAAAESSELKGMRALFGRIGAVLPVASSRDLRELREGYAMLANAIANEFGKRGMEFERDGSAAVLERLGNELEVAVKPEPLPKDFAFSDRRVMELRAIADAQRMELVAADAQIAEARAGAAGALTTAREDLLRILDGQVAPGTTYSGEPGTIAEVVGMVQARLDASANVALERDTSKDLLLEAQQSIVQMGKTRDELAKAADAAVARADAAERELEEFKKHHKKPKCG